MIIGFSCFMTSGITLPQPDTTRDQVDMDHQKRWRSFSPAMRCVRHFPATASHVFAVVTAGWVVSPAHYYWPGEYADRNRTVANQRLSGSNAWWKWTTEYNCRSIAETAMYRVKQLFGGSLTPRDYDCQVAEALAMVRALNKMTKAGMPKNIRIA